MKLAAFFNGIQSGTDQRSIVHIELLRIIAVCLVIFNHTNTKGFFLFSVSQGSVFYPLYLFISVADKIAVPIFFMISGALLAGKDEPIRDIYKKRVLRIAVVLIAVSLFYYTYDCLSTAEAFSITQFLIKVYSGSVAIELWYLYSYLGILVILPLLRILARGMTQYIYIYIYIYSDLSAYHCRYHTYNAVRYERGDGKNKRQLFSRHYIKLQYFLFSNGIFFRACA